LSDEDINRRDGIGEQSIHHAARRKNDKAFAILKLLLWAGCELDEQSRYGNTPLHLAVSARIAKALIQGGADIESRRSSLEYCFRNGHTPLHEHAFEGNIEIVEILIQAGANINARSHDGKTPLGWCLRRAGKRASIIALLRAHGATE
jgi:ankyrin repeat protein